MFLVVVVVLVEVEEVGGGGGWVFGGCLVLVEVVEVRGD